MHDPVEAPNHYKWHPSGVECKDIVQEFPYNIGTAMAYLWRCGRKDSSTKLEDLRKAKRHLEFEIARLDTSIDVSEQEWNDLAADYFAKPEHMPYDTEGRLVESDHNNIALDRANYNKNVSR